MKRLLLFSVMLCMASNSRSQTRHVSVQEFQAQVDSALRFVLHGHQLYRVTDLFHRLVDRRVEIHLGLSHSGDLSECSLAVQGDTSRVADISKTTSDETEPSIAISRKNPSLIVAGANDDVMFSTGMPAYVTTNAGITWRTYRVPHVDGFSDSGDPILVSDDSGNFYYSFMVSYDKTPYGDPYRTNLMVARSTDGIHWVRGGLVLSDTNGGTLQDKEMIAVDCDPSSPYHGRIYIVWTQYYTGWSGRRLISHSDDHGKTWSTPVEWTQDFGYFATVRVGAKGVVFISSSHIDSLKENPYHALSVSTDGGMTFTDYPIAEYQDYPETYGWLNALKGNPLVYDDPGFRAFPYITMNVDPQSNRAFVVYGSLDPNGYATQYTTESDDLGNTWSTPQPIEPPDLVEADRFFPWVTVDALTHDVSVAFYTSDASNVNVNLSCTPFHNPSQFQALGSDLFDPRNVIQSLGASPFIGDYIGADAYDGYYAVAWTESRLHDTSDGDIYAYVSSPVSAVGSGTPQPINSDIFAAQISPNPVRGNSVSLTISSNQERTAIIHIYDLNGRADVVENSHITPGDSTPCSLDVTSLPAGVYRVVISSGGNQLTRNLLILR